MLCTIFKDRQTVQPCQPPSILIINAFRLKAWIPLDHRLVHLSCKPCNDAKNTYTNVFIIIFGKIPHLWHASMYLRNTKIFALKIFSGFSIQNSEEQLRFCLETNINALTKLTYFQNVNHS